MVFISIKMEIKHYKSSQIFNKKNCLVVLKTHIDHMVFKKLFKVCAIFFLKNWIKINKLFLIIYII